MRNKTDLLVIILIAALFVRCHFNNSKNKRTTDYQFPDMDMDYPAFQRFPGGEENLHNYLSNTEIPKEEVSTSISGLLIFKLFI